MKLSACIEKAAGQLDRAGVVFGHGTDNAWDEAAWLTLHALGLPVDQQADLDLELDEDQQSAVAVLVKKRIDTRKPAAYLTGTAWFAGRPFHITDGIIVPRSHIGGFLHESGRPWVRPEKVHCILDLCTGSGCIAITAAHEFPGATVDATDISTAALELATRNIAEYGLEERVNLIHSDLYQELDSTYDLILTNPPYVPDPDVDAFPAEYRHEPRRAFAGGIDGLDLVHVILKNAKNYLNPEGLLVCEVGESWRTLQDCYPDVPFHWVETGVDDSGLFVISREELEKHF